MFDTVSLSEADFEIRLNHPHLIPSWLAGIPSRFANWFDTLCSRENLNYAGFFGKRSTADELAGCREIFRLKFPDYYPSFTQPANNAMLSRLDPPPHIAEVSSAPSLQNLKSILHTSSYGSSGSGKSPRWTRCVSTSPPPLKLPTTRTTKPTCGMYGRNLRLALAKVV